MASSTRTIFRQRSAAKPARRWRAPCMICPKTAWTCPPRFPVSNARLSAPPCADRTATNPRRLSCSGSDEPPSSTSYASLECEGLALLAGAAGMHEQVLLHQVFQGGHVEGFFQTFVADGFQEMARLRGESTARHEHDVGSPFGSEFPDRKSVVE